MSDVNKQHKLLGDEVKQLKAEHIQLEQWPSQRQCLTGTYIQCGQEVLRAQHEKLYEALVSGLMSDEKGGA